MLRLVVGGHTVALVGDFVQQTRRNKLRLCIRLIFANHFGMSITYSRTNFRLPVWPCAYRQRNT